MCVSVCLSYPQGRNGFRSDGGRGAREDVIIFGPPPVRGLYYIIPGTRYSDRMQYFERNNRLHVYTYSILRLGILCYIECVRDRKYKIKTTYIYSSLAVSLAPA